MVQNVKGVQLRYEEGFCKTSANIFLNSAGLTSPAGRVWGELGKGTQVQDLLRYLCIQSIQKVYCSRREKYGRGPSIFVACIMILSYNL